MQKTVVAFVLTLAFFNIPTSAEAKIAVNRGTIVKIIINEDENKIFFFGSIVFERGSIRDDLGNKKRNLVSANITAKTAVISGGRGGGGLKLSDLKPGMAIIISLTGSRGGLDAVWEVSSIQVITLDELLRP